MDNPEEQRELSPEERIAALTPDDWEQLRTLHDETATHTGPFAEATGGGEDPDGTIVLGYTQSAPVVDKTREFFYDKNLILYGFDWESWDEGREMLENEVDDKFNGISLDDTLKLFTAIIRNDRFSEGVWVNFFGTGDAEKLLSHLLTFTPEKP